MGLGKLIKKVKSCVGDKDKRKDCEEMDSLLEKLREKAAKLERKLEKAKSGSERKHLKLELKIIAAQLKKGQKYIDARKKG